MRLTLRRTAVAGVVVVAIATSCGGETGEQATGSPRNPAVFAKGGAYRPAFRPADFVDVIDNPYHPLLPGTVRRYEGTSDGEKEVNVIEVTNERKTVLGVKATVVRDRVYDADGKLAEETRDWFAQDRQGNVWYLGEDTKEFSDGKVSTKGSWEAGVKGARPGIVMLGSPRVGDRYQQEYSKGEAEDRGRIVALHESVVVPFGPFADVIVTEESTPLEPDVLERKYYARGIGVVLERLISGGREVMRLVDVKPRPRG